MTGWIRLGDIAHARSGDKGNHANVGVIAYTDAGFRHLGQVLTEARVAEFLLALRPREVRRYELPGIRAYNFVLSDVLGGGASRSLRTDSQGKTLSLALLELQLTEPADLDTMRPARRRGDSMNNPLVKYDVRAQVAEIRLNRAAKRNALTRELIAQLTAAVARVAAEPGVRLAILSAEGPAFCAGMDLEEMQRRALDPNAGAEWQKDARDYRDLLVAILRLDVPTLAVVQGAAVAGGFGLVLACDIVLASTDARFALPEAKRGISPAVVAPLLIHRAGAGAATPILLSSRTVAAEEAQRLNLCHHLASPDRLDETRRELVASILSGAPGALAMTKRLVRSFVESRLLDQLEAGAAISAAARETAEAREGLAAFLESRSPSWNAAADSDGRP